MNNLEEELQDLEENRVSRRAYFTMIENSFILNPNIPVIEKMVFITLCSYAGKKSSCFPGQTEIAKKLNVTRQTVNSAIKNLEKKGGILILKQYTETNRKTVNTYFLADVDQKTGEFITESLNIYIDLVKEPKMIKGN